ncbi:hypothetical protein CBR_g37572 [Chara braunii]|uniref:Tf2-1-like SH3-like domain-containing protein n=1 Tax=Chara braunii TaxID=69332 RepID=A0A388LND1_CHABU|nr:hypothetical protein CBR_g37572 [Chara braunii]|eukprot:GBG83771.1 hypothetical protein CBR_g37572 [Chara braunii]
MEDWAFGLGVDKLLQALEDRFADKERACKAADKIARLGQQRYSGTLQSLFAEFEQLTFTPGLAMSTDDLLTNFCRAAPEKFVVALYIAGHKDWRSFGRATLDMEVNLHVQAPSSDRRKGAFPCGGRKGKATFAHAGSASAAASDSQADTPSAGTGSTVETNVAATLTQAVLGVLQQQKRLSPTTASASAKGKDKGRRPYSSQRPNLPKDVHMPADPLNPSTLPCHDLKIQEGVWRRRKERGVCLRCEGQHFLKDCPYMPGPDQQDWDLHLAQAQLVYNMSVHSSTGFSPYRLHWGREPRQPLDDIIDKAKSDLTPGTAEFTRRYSIDVERARANLFKAQKAMIEQANRHRRPSPIRTCDYVWVASSELSREEDISPKLLPRYLGPWQVLDTMGADPFGPSYVIDVPLQLRTYPVFHASKLLPFTPTDAFPDRPPQFGPPIPGKGYDVEWIEDEWGTCPDRQYLVRFAFQPPTENRWFYRKELLKTTKSVVLRYEAAQKGNLPRRSPRLHP